MGAISKVLRDSQDNGLVFWCPGCNDSHRVQHGKGDGPGWVWNGNVDKPTFSPSVLVRTGHYCKQEGSDSCWCTYNAAHPEEPSTFECRICHSFIIDGNIQFLNDCSHKLAGHTVPLPTYPCEDNENIEV